MKEIEQQTGEEDEDLMFKTDGALYEYVSTEEDGKAPGWRERGRGEFRINSTKKKDNVRMIMRTRGNFRLILNASMFKGQKFAKMEGGKGVTFPCVNAASENKKMTTYALKMRVAQSSAAQQVDTFLEQITKSLLIAGRGVYERILKMLKSSFKSVMRVNLFFFKSQMVVLSMFLVIAFSCLIRHQTLNLASPIRSDRASAALQSPGPALTETSERLPSA